MTDPTARGSLVSSPRANTDRRQATHSRETSEVFLRGSSNGPRVEVWMRKHCQLFGCSLVVASVFSNCYVRAMTHYTSGGRRMSLSRWDEERDSDYVTVLNRDTWLVGHCKIPAWQLAKLPRYGREGAVEVRPFPTKKGLRVSEAQGLSGEAMKGNPTTTIPRVDESKSKASNNRRLDRTDANPIPCQPPSSRGHRKPARALWRL
jgi:hypothetical protein